MATGGAGAATTPQPIVHPLHRAAPPPPTQPTAVSPPSRRELASWWRKFRKTAEKQDEKVDVGRGIFGVPLADSIRYANVAISLQNEHGESFIYGYVPIVVAKCGVFLKEKATDVEGIFRLSGSAKRIKDLQTIFNSPDRYGKGLDWTGYTVHDAANIFRRYLNQLPEPIVPLSCYERFRDPLRTSQSLNASGTDGEVQPRDLTVEEHAAAVSAYQRLITELPPLNRQLLLYILDLLAVFASKADLNRMTAANLAAIFQPGIISHPSHDMSPQEYRLSQDVLIFLIENQDNFLIGMSGTAVDEKTQKDVESGPPSLRSAKPLGRSASNASGGADSLRKYGVRRNVSVSSRGSRDRNSPGVSSPGTPVGVTSFSSGPSASVLSRSNTVPSKRSPALAPGRFLRVNDAPGASPPMGHSPEATPSSITPTSPGPGPNNIALRQTGSVAVEVPVNQPSMPAAQAGRSIISPMPLPPSAPPTTSTANAAVVPVMAAASAIAPPLGPLSPNQPSQAPPAPSGTRDRKLSNLFPKSPIFGPSDPQGRQPKKLQKKQRIPGAVNESAHSSLNSLQGDDPGSLQAPLAAPDVNHANSAEPRVTAPTPDLTTTSPTPTDEPPTFNAPAGPPAGEETLDSAAGLKARRSPPGSIQSRSSFTDNSEADASNDPTTALDRDKHRRRWRFSSSAKKAENSPLAPPPPVSLNHGARGSNSSLGSSTRPRKSFTGDSHSTQAPPTEASGQQAPVGGWNPDYLDPPNVETEKKGLFGKWKAKMSQTKEERQAEKDRAKSPPRNEPGASRSSLAAFAQEHLTPRGRSLEKQREGDWSEARDKSAGNDRKLSVGS